MNSNTARIATYAGTAVAGIATACLLAAPTHAVQPTPDQGEHNARVAEYLLLQDQASGEHNAQVAELLGGE